MFRNQETPREPLPHITPEMIEKTFEALEAEGMIYYSEGGVYVPTEKGWKLLMKADEAREEIVAYGSSRIKAVDTDCLIITKNSEIKKDENSVIAVNANKACRDLDEKFKQALKNSKKVEITIECGGMEDKIIAFGSPALKLSSKEDLLIRKDSTIDGRTLTILANKSANELNQDLIDELRKDESEIKITLEIK